MTIIYHNPRCSKSRQTLELLTERDVDFEIVEYLKNPLSKADIENILRVLKLPIRDIMRKKEVEYKELNLDDKSMSEDELINHVVNCPKLLERPIVINGERGAIGRPPENILEII